MPLHEAQHGLGLVQVNTRREWGSCEYVIVHTMLPPSAVILWIEVGGKPKWLPMNFGHHDVIRRVQSFLQNTPKRACSLHTLAYFVERFRSAHETLYTFEKPGEAVRELFPGFSKALTRKQLFL